MLGECGWFYYLIFHKLVYYFTFFLKYFKVYFLRKSSVASVNIIPGNGRIFINGKDISSYFQNNSMCDFCIGV